MVDFELGEQFLRRAEQELALFGQKQAARMTVEQRDLELVLKRRDLPADGGLGEPQFVAAMGKALCFSGRVEDAQLVPIERHNVTGLFRRQLESI